MAFWSMTSSLSMAGATDKVLDRESHNLKDLLDCDDILNQVLAPNDRLISFLSQPDMVFELVDLAIAPPPTRHSRKSSLRDADTPEEGRAEDMSGASGQHKTEESSPSARAQAADAEKASRESGSGASESEHSTSSKDAKSEEGRSEAGAEATAAEAAESEKGAASREGRDTDEETGERDSKAGGRSDSDEKHSHKYGQAFDDGEHVEYREFQDDDHSEELGFAEESDDEFEENRLRQIRYSKVSAEILTTDVWMLLDALLSNEKAMEHLWSVLEAEAEATAQQLGLLTKIVESLLEKRLDRMLDFLRTLPHFVDYFIRYIECQPLVDFLIKVISTDHPESPTDIIDFLYEQDLIPKMIELLGPDVLHSAQSAAGDFLKAFVNISGGNKSDICAIGPSELSRQFVGYRCMSRLIEIMLAGGHGMCVAVTVIIETIRKNNSDYDMVEVTDTTLETHPPDPRDNIYLGTMVKLFARAIPQFQAMLVAPETRTMKMPFGEIKPLGFERFRICELYAELLHCSNMNLLNDLLGEEIIQERDAERNRVFFPGRELPNKIPDEADSDKSVRITADKELRGESSATAGPQGEAGASAESGDGTNGPRDGEVSPNTAAAGDKKSSDRENGLSAEAKDDSAGASGKAATSHDTKKPSGDDTNDADDDKDSGADTATSTSPSTSDSNLDHGAAAISRARRDSGPEPDSGAGEEGLLLGEDSSSDSDTDVISPEGVSGASPTAHAPDVSLPTSPAELIDSPPQSPSPPTLEGDSGDEIDYVGDDRQKLNVSNYRGKQLEEFLSRENRSLRRRAVVGDQLKFALDDNHCIDAVLRMLFEFPWNNFLHNVVFDIVQQVFNGYIDHSYNKFLAIHLFTRAHLTEQIVRGQRANEDHEREKNIRLGYVGHLTLISEEIVKFGGMFIPESISPEIAESLGDRDWIAYVHNDLLQLREQYNTVLGKVSLIEEEDEDSYDVQDDDENDRRAWPAELNILQDPEGELSELYLRGLRSENGRDSGSGSGSGSGSNSNSNDSGSGSGSGLEREHSGSDDDMGRNRARSGSGSTSGSSDSDTESDSDGDEPNADDDVGANLNTMLRLRPQHHHLEDEDKRASETEGEAEGETEGEVAGKAAGKAAAGAGGSAAAAATPKSAPSPAAKRENVPKDESEFARYMSRQLNSDQFSSGSSDEEEGDAEEGDAEASKEAWEPSKEDWVPVDANARSDEGAHA